MKPGLYIIVVPSGYNPFVLIGWLRRVEDPAEPYGDEYEMLGGRVIRRFGPNVELGVLARKGPQAGTELLRATKRESYHRLSWGRSIDADIVAWAKDCPRPEGWE